MPLGRRAGPVAVVMLLSTRSLSDRGNRPGSTFGR
jgi:hypothetical protein